MVDDRAGAASLQNMVDRLPGAIWELGLAPGPHPHEMAVASLRALPGIDLAMEGDATGSRGIVLHPEDRVTLVAALQQSASSGDGVRCVVRARDRSGAWRWLRLLSARTAILGRQEATYKSDLRAARDWVRKYFDTRTKPVQAMLDTVGQMLATPLPDDLPDLAASLDAVRTLKATQERRMAPPPVTPARPNR